MNWTYIHLYRYDRGYPSSAEMDLLIPLSFDKRELKKSWIEKLVEKILKWKEVNKWLQREMKKRRLRG